jgi:hypothetical protein
MTALTSETLSKETGLPKWWLAVALGETTLEHKAKTAREAMSAYHEAEKGSSESAAAYRRYSQLAVVDFSNMSDIEIRHQAAYNDFYQRLEKTTTIEQVVAMLNEQGVIPGSPLWDAALEQLVTFKKAQLN